MSADKQIRLATEALQLKKAWLLTAAVMGVGHQLTKTEYIIPKYLTWNIKSLKQHIEDLKDDFESHAKQLLLDWKRSNLPSTAAWFAKQYDAWQESGFTIFNLGRVLEFEAVVGRLGHRRIMDCPPYAQIVLQGFNGAAIRHPEYHLATDLALLYNLFLDSQAIMDEAARKMQIHSSEYNQSLGRSVILTCFNLLESFVSGLAVAFLMENRNAPAEVIKKLEDKSLSLRKRLNLVTALISGQPGIMNDSQSPIQPLFDECKERRDSFVHCEPGPMPTKWGYVKEQHFHDVNLAVVKKTVDLTCETICVAWKAVHGKDKPSWLPKRDTSGRFPRVYVSLQESVHSGSEPKNSKS